MNKGFTPLEIPNVQKNRIKLLTGFTLIELLFVIIILSILIAIALPQLKNNYTSLQLSTFSQDLQSYMVYLRQQSIVAQETFMLNIDNGAREYWAGILNDKNRLKTVYIPQDIQVAADQTQIAFYPDGSIDNVTIKLSDANKQAISLTTKGVYGSVKVQR